MNPLFNKMQGIFQRCLEINSEAQNLLKQIEVTNGEFALALGLGYVDFQTLRASLTLKEHDEAVTLGIIGARGGVAIKECLSLPLYREGQIVGFMGWHLKKSKRYFAGSSEGIVEPGGIEHKTLYVVNNLIHYVQLKQLGFDNTTFLTDVSKPDYLLQCIKASGVKAVYIIPSKAKDTLLSYFKDQSYDCYYMALDKRKALDAKCVDKATVCAEKFVDGKVKMVIDQGPPKHSSIPGNADLLEFTLGAVSYSVKVERLKSASLKIVLTAAMDEARHTDKIDLYMASSRRAFSKACAERFMEDAVTFEADLHKLITELEAIRDNKKTAEVVATIPSEAEEAEAIEALKNPNILDEFVTDMRATGFVGEEANLKLGFLMGISRLLDKPLTAQ